MTVRASTPETRSIRVPKPLSIGLVIAALLVAAIVVNLGASVYREQVAVRALRDAGATVNTYGPRPKWLGRVFGRDVTRPFERITDIYLEILDTTDADLAPIKDTRSVETLTIWSDRITDAGFESVAAVHGLRELHAGGIHLTDAGLQCISRLGDLEELDISSSDVTDVGMAHVRNLRSLRGLRVAYTKITDDCLAYLKNLPKLRRVDLTGTYVTDAGVDELQRELPGLQIDR